MTHTCSFWQKPTYLSITYFRTHVRSASVAATESFPGYSYNNLQYSDNGALTRARQTAQTLHSSLTIGVVKPLRQGPFHGKIMVRGYSAGAACREEEERVAAYSAGGGDGGAVIEMRRDIGSSSSSAAKSLRNLAASAP